MKEHIEDGLRQLESRLGGEQKDIATRTLEAQFDIFARRARGEDTSADEAHVRAIAANLEHSARRTLEEVWMGVVGRIARSVLQIVVPQSG